MLTYLVPTTTGDPDSADEADEEDAMPFDMDAARAARREATGEEPTFIFGGEEFSLPIELPLEFIERLDDVEALRQAKDVPGMAKVVLGIVRLLLGDAYSRFMAQKPSLGDLEEFVEGVMGSYGSPPESSGSEPSSETTSSPSNPTSSPTTA